MDVDPEDLKRWKAAQPQLPVPLTEREALLSRLLFEAGERVHSTHVSPHHFTTLVNCQTSNLCQRIMAALLAQMEPPPPPESP